MSFNNMIEKEILSKCCLYFEEQFGNEVALWRSPSYKKRRWDIFGVFDILVIFNNFKAPYLIQCTTLTNLSHRRKKINAFWETLGWRYAHSYVFAWDEKNNCFKIEKV